MPTLLDYPGVSRIWHWSPAPPYGSPYTSDKIIFWAFLRLYCLSFSPFFFLIQITVSAAFLHAFSHWQRLFLASKRSLRILIVCTSCKTSYNVLKHSHWGLGQFVGWLVKKKERLQILDLQRLASLHIFSCNVPSSPKIPLTIRIRRFRFRFEILKTPSRDLVSQEGLSNPNNKREIWIQYNL